MTNIKITAIFIYFFTEKIYPIISISNNIPFNPKLSFFNPKTNELLRPPIVTFPINGESLRMPNVGWPCNCANLNCGCCVGLDIQQTNFKQNLCSNLTYHPSQFGIEMDLSFNENSLYNNMISGRDPPKICIPIPQIPFIEICIKLFDIFTSGRNIHLCLDLQGQVANQPVVVLHFDCMHMGQDGVGLVKPGDTSWIRPSNQIGGPDPPQIASNVFDIITETKRRPK